MIVLDIMLPGLDGYQVFERACGTPTIFLTAKSELSDKLKGLAAGADDYLTKPFQMLELAPGWKPCCGGPKNPRRNS